jgi:hypothetical protein
VKIFSGAGERSSRVTMLHACHRSAGNPGRERQCRRDSRRPRQSLPIDSSRMVIRVEQGKGRKDRYVIGAGFIVSAVNGQAELVRADLGDCGVGLHYVARLILGRLR